MVQSINNVLRTERELIQELGRDPTKEEIAKELEIPVKKVGELFRALKIGTLASLDAPAGEGMEDATLGDIVEDKNLEDPAEAAIKNELGAAVTDTLDCLTPRERLVIKKKYGLLDGRERTIAEIGKELELSRQRISQIEAKALEKLRGASQPKKLRDYLD